MVKRKRLEIEEGINFLSPLEEKIMECLWKNSESTVAEIAKDLQAPLSSIAVTIDRLIQHGYVIRKKEKVSGRMKYVYSPILMKEDAKKKMVEDILDSLMDKFEDVVVNYFEEKSSRNGKR